MLRLSVSLSCLSLALTASTLAGPMPVLPDLPPLPTHYESQGAGGPYAGLLAGYGGGAESGADVALVLGNTFSAADLLLGVEALATAASHGEVTLEGGFRAGAGLTETISVFGGAGLGYSFDTGAFVSIGTSLEADVGGGWLFRADYRYNHDLSGDTGTHKVLAGLLYSF